LARRQSKARRASSGQRLGQHQRAVHEVQQAEAPGREERRARAERAEEAAERRPQDEADAEGRADQPEVLRALLGRGDVGDERVGRREGRPGHAGDRAAEEQPRERGGQAHHDVVDAERADREEQHRAAPVAVGEVAEDGRAHELHRRVDEREPAAVDRGLADGVAGQLDEQPRQDRDDQPEADDVEQDGDDDEDERVLAGRTGQERSSASAARKLRSRAKALPRWLTWSFSARGTSPKVAP
jgi:hypothetical protein